MYIIDGYLITEIFDINNPDQVKLFAEKKWDDGSFDWFHIYDIPNNDSELFDYIYDLCENRTIEDIINNHYKTIIKNKKDLLEEEYINSKYSFEAWKNGKYTTAINILNNINKSTYNSFERCKQSLIKHLKTARLLNIYDNYSGRKSESIIDMWYESINMLFPNSNIEYALDTYLDT